MSTASEYRRRVYAEARRLGWELIRSTGHSTVWRHDGLHLQVALSKTPSDHRAIQSGSGWTAGPASPGSRPFNRSCLPKCGQRA